MFAVSRKIMSTNSVNWVTEKFKKDDYKYKYNKSLEHLSKLKWNYNMKDESIRLKSFYKGLISGTKWPIKYISKKELSRNGFFYLKNTIVQCAYCLGIVNHWKIGDYPNLIHKKYFPNCYFLNELELKNRIINSKNYGNNFREGPKNIFFCSDSARKKSFNLNWKCSYPVSIKNLVEAGFYSIGIKDCVKCFYCDGLLFEWKIDDDPWTEHARWFPNCGFIKLFSNITSTTNYFKNNDKNCFYETNKKDSILGINCNKRVENICKIKESSKKINIETLCCKICFERDIDIVFLPCGHQYCCFKCANFIKKCSICRKLITLAVKTYFS